MCLLPPNCLFCKHFHQDARQDEADCDAFKEIPDVILTGGHQHSTPIEGDRGIRFKLEPAIAEEFFEVQELRRRLSDA